MSCIPNTQHTTQNSLQCIHTIGTIHVYLQSIVTAVEEAQCTSITAYDSSTNTGVFVMLWRFVTPV